jgi:60 kDa SS-A/Ro ribonucleoprotein
MIWANGAKYVGVNPLDSTLTIAQSITFTGGGTDFNSIFSNAQIAYDRVIILSDMQGWIGFNTPKASFEAYKNRTGANPHVYSFDLQGYGSMQFPEKRVYCLAGFSEKTLGIMQRLETDRNALVKAVESVDL